MNLRAGYRRVGHRVDIIRDGVFLKNLISANNEVPTINMSKDAELKTWMTGLFFGDKDLDPLNDLLQVYLLLDGVAYPVGEYMISRADEDEHGHIKVEGYNKALRLQQSKLERRVFYPAGTRYLDVVLGLLTQNGIEIAIADECEDTLQTDREDWEIGASCLEIANGLLNEINFEGLWFDATGVARLKRKVRASANGITQIYEADEYSIIAQEHSSAMDAYDAPNVFMAIVNSPDYEAPLIATAINDYPSSALSTVNRGRRIQAPVEKLDNIASMEALQQYVDNRRDQSMLTTEIVQFQTAKNPTHSVGDIVALNKPGLVGIFEETEWSMRLEAGALMQHKARRAVYL